MDIENQELLNPQNEGAPQGPVVKNLEISGEISTQLNEAGKWGSFLSILGFVFIGLVVFAGFIFTIVLAFLPRMGNSPFPFPTFLIGFFYLALAAVYFFPILYLYRFSSGIKLALRQKDQGRLSLAFSNLKAHYRFIGIMMIVVLVMYLLMIVILLFTSLFSGLTGFMGAPA